MESVLNQTLARELERRCQKNPRYSVRAFAKAIGVSPATLSLILTEKRGVSRSLAKKIVKTLDLSHEEIGIFVKRAAIQGSQNKNGDLNSETNTSTLSLDEFSLIAHWYHYAILSLTLTKDFQFEQTWIAQRLGISAAQAKIAMDRLLRMGLIAKQRGRWIQVSPPIRIGNNVPTSASKSFQKQLLEKAVESLENDSLETRDFSSNTLCMHPDLIPYAREKIRDFRRKLAEELEHLKPGIEVYNLTMQIFPSSRLQKQSAKKRNEP